MTENAQMPRTTGVQYEPNGYEDVLDFTIDYAHDAVDSGVDYQAVVIALRDAADEIERQ